MPVGRPKPRPKTGRKPKPSVSYGGYKFTGKPKPKGSKHKRY